MFASLKGMVMKYNDVGIVILAAGRGTRMKSDTPKVIHKVAGKSMIIYVLETARKIITDNIHIVVGYKAEDVKKEINQCFQVNYVHQKNLIGTGDAVKSALPGISSTINDILVLCGDVPLIKKDTIQNLIDKHKQNQAKITVLAVNMDDPTGYGRVILDDSNNMLCIREEADASLEEKTIQKINSGIYCFDKKFLEFALDAIQPDNNQGEYYLTDVVEIAQKYNEKIIIDTMDDHNQVLGVNTPEQLKFIEKLI